MCDASFADDRLTRKRQQGHLIFHNSRPIIWKSNRQHTIDLSTIETELDVFVNCVRSVLHTMRILEIMGSPQYGINMIEDNRSTIEISCSVQTKHPGKSRTKHVDMKIKCKTLAERRHQGTSCTDKPQHAMMTDILTKSFPRETFVRCIVNALKLDDNLPPIVQNQGEC